MRAVARASCGPAGGRWSSSALLAGLVAGVVAAAAAVATADGDGVRPAGDGDPPRRRPGADLRRLGDAGRGRAAARGGRSRGARGRSSARCWARRSSVTCSVSSGPPRDPDLFSPVRGAGPGAAGRRAADEVMVPEIVAREIGVHLGDTAAGQAADPAGGHPVRHRLRRAGRAAARPKVVGVVRTSRYWVGNGVGAGRSGRRRSRQAAAGSFVGQDVLVAAAARRGRCARVRPGGQPARPAGRDRRHRPGVRHPAVRATPTSDGDPEEVAARHTLVDGLLVLRWCVAAGRRAAGGDPGAGPPPRARRRRPAARGRARPDPGRAGAGPAAARAWWVRRSPASWPPPAALAAGAVEPLGPLKDYEPHPGYLAAPLVVGLGGRRRGA